MGDGSRVGAYEFDREDWKGAASGRSLERGFFGFGVASLLGDLPQACSVLALVGVLGSGLLDDFLGRGVVLLSSSEELMAQHVLRKRGSNGMIWRGG